MGEAEGGREGGREGEAPDNFVANSVLQVRRRILIMLSRRKETQLGATSKDTSPFSVRCLIMTVHSSYPSLIYLSPPVLFDPLLKDAAEETNSSLRRKV